MAEFAYTDMLPLGADDTPYRLLTTEGVSDGRGRRPHLPEGRPRGADAAHRDAMHDIAHLLRPAHLAQLRAHPRRPGGLPERPVRRPATC